MNNKLYNKQNLFLILFILTVYLLINFVFAQELNSEITPILIISYIIGIIEISIGAVSLYFLFKASKAFGGRLGYGMYRLTVATISLCVLSLIVGIIVIISERGYKINDLIFLIISIIGFITAIVSIIGSRAIINSVKK